MPCDEHFVFARRIDAGLESAPLGLGTLPMPDKCIADERVPHAAVIDAAERN
jgi:hypothetical protein